MKDAAFYLFEERFNDSPLFKNQLDLITQLLSTPPYYVTPQDEHAYTKALNRLKAYVSQLLSGSVTRNITQDFRMALGILLTKKLRSKSEADAILEHIIEDLKSKHIQGTRQETKSLAKDTFTSDIYNSTYVSIVSAKPITPDLSTDTQGYSLKDIFLGDLMHTLLTESRPMKMYRFNFPLYSYCENFWIALENVLQQYIRQLIDTRKFIDILYSQKFAIKTSTHELFEAYSQLAEISEDSSDLLSSVRENLVQAMSSDIVELLNRNRLVAAFHVLEPIYTIPFIALNPDDTIGGKLYLFSEDETKRTMLFRSSDESRLLWRIFVWDIIKTTKKSVEVKCSSLMLSEIESSRAIKSDSE